MRVDLILKNAGVIDESGTFFTGKNLLIHQGKIYQVTDELPAEIETAEVMDCSQYIISPGLVNLHTHSPMNLFRGLAEDVSIEDWFNLEIWPYERNMTADHASAGTMAAIYEMLDAGVTAFADHYMFPEAIIHAVQQTGIRCDLAPTLFGVSESFEKDLAEAGELVRKYQGHNSRLALRLGPHSPYTCSPEQLKEVADVAKELKTGIHIHISETEQQLKDSMKRFGKTPFQVLAEAGGFEVPVIVAHGLWIQPEDRKLLTRETAIAMSPKTYLKLAMGQGHLWNGPEELPLAVGTDGAASSNSLNPLEQVRLFGLLGKHFSQDATQFSCKSLWKILMAGHGALPFNTGKVKAGAEADLVFWDLSSPGVMPVHNPLAAILYSSSNQQVRHVMVGGQWVKFDGWVKMDEKAVQQELMEKSQHMMKLGKGKTPLQF